MAAKMKYKVVKNNTPTQDRAPYTGLVTPAYELDFGDFVGSLAGEASAADAGMVAFFFAALYEFIAEDMPANLNRYNLGSFTVEAQILGSFPSEDAEFDEDRNSVVVGATLAQAVADAVGDIVPARDADSVATDVRLNTVMDIESQTYATIDGVKEFRLAGQKLYVSEADEYVRVRAADGGVTDCTVTKTDENGQRVYAKLPAVLPAGTYTLEIASHGGDAAKPLAIITRKVKVLGAAAPVPPVPEPEITAVEGEGEGVVNVTSPFTITGNNLEGATVGLVYNGAAEPFCTVAMTYADGKLTGNAGFVGDLENQYGCVRVTTAGGTAMYPVTFENH